MIAAAKLTKALRAFLLLFTFRYLRLVVGIAAVYKPALFSNLRESLHRPCGKTYRKYAPVDVTVIIPTVTPFGPEFEATVHSALDAGCGKLIIVTVGEEKLALASSFCDSLDDKRADAIAIMVASKRAQLAAGLLHVKTELVVFADDHVFWPCGSSFLSSVAAPFSDPRVGAVGTHKRVRRSPAFPISADSFLNLLGCLYLERHNFDLAATSSVDGSVFVLSGRTSAWRSEIVTHGNFLRAFLNERWFFGKVGPLNADDDNLLTRWVVNRGWKVEFQTEPKALVGTTLGVDGGSTLGRWTKFHAQIVRWARTTARSNSTALLADREVWRSQPWGVYAIFLTSFVNFALLTDAALMFLARRAAIEIGFSLQYAVGAMVLWVLASKLVKTWSHFARHPQDLVYLPACIAFGYYHSLVKLYAMVTAGNVAWGSRPGLVK